MLPYLEQIDLYKKFKLDEPWDSPNNKPLIKEMPKVFGEDRSGKTAYRVLDFKNSVMASMLKFPEQRDEKKFRYGQSDTGFLFVVGEDKKAIWTKPGGLEFDTANQKSVEEILGKPPIEEGWLMSYFYQQRHAFAFSIIPPKTPMEKFEAVANRNDRDRIKKPGTFPMIYKKFYIDSYGVKHKLRADFD